MFKIDEKEFTNKTLRMERSLVDELSRCATNNDISFNSLVVQCCTYSLESIYKTTPETNKQENNRSCNVQKK